MSNEKIKEGAFLLITALAVLLAMYGANLFGISKTGIWGAVLALSGTGLGFVAFPWMQEAMGGFLAGVVFAFAVVGALFASTITLTGGLNPGNLGFVFLVFSFLSPLSKAVRKQVVSG